MKRVIAWAAPLAAMALHVPAAAQASGDSGVPELGAENENLLDALSGMFVAEPLTPEQQARLPLAMALVEKVMPPGALSEAFGGMFDEIISPLADIAPFDARTVIARRIGLFGGAELTDEQATWAANLLDPAWEERERRQRALMPQMMSGVMDAMEPPMRQAMAELYAINFTEAELADIDAFFATPTGAAYARRSYTMASDPRMTAASMSAMPAMMQGMADLESELAAATADLPSERTWADFSASERKQLARLLGYSEEELELTLQDFDETELDAEY